MLWQKSLVYFRSHCCELMNCGKTWKLMSCRNRFVNAPSQWETTLHCNVTLTSSLIGWARSQNGPWSCESWLSLWLLREFKTIRMECCFWLNLICEVGNLNMFCEELCHNLSWDWNSTLPLVQLPLGLASKNWVEPVKFVLGQVKL